MILPSKVTNKRLQVKLNGGNFFDITKNNDTWTYDNIQKYCHGSRRWL